MLKFHKKNEYENFKRKMRKFCGKNEKEIINYDIIELIMLSSQSIRIPQFILRN